MGKSSLKRWILNKDGNTDNTDLYGWTRIMILIPALQLWASSLCTCSVLLFFYKKKRRISLLWHTIEELLYKHNVSWKHETRQRNADDPDWMDLHRFVYGLWYQLQFSIATSLRRNPFIGIPMWGFYQNGVVFWRLETRRRTKDGNSMKDKFEIDDYQWLNFSICWWMKVYLWANN